MKIPFWRRLLLFGALSAASGMADSPPQAPQVIEQVKPEYPDALRSAGIAGKVVVQFGVDATGAVENVSVYTADHPELGPLAVEAVRKWRFRPATRDGRPTETRILRVSLTFGIPPTPFRSFRSFDEALAQAEKEHKIVFVDFFTTWCEPCRRLRTDTWENPSVIALLKEKTIAMEIDAEKQAALASRYSVNAYPTLAFIRPDGTLIDSLVGYRDAPTFTAEFADVIAGKTRLQAARDSVAQAGADGEKLAKARYDMGRELALKGKDAEALAEYLWCFDTGMRQAASYGGVRVSFLLADIAELGAHYPPAMDALRSRRDADRRRLSEDAASAGEFGGLNHYLGEDNATLSAFDALAPGSGARQALGTWVFDLLLDARRYDDAASVMPASTFGARFAVMRTNAPDDSMRGYLAESAAKEIEVLAGAGRLDDARALLKTLLDYDHSAATVASVTGHLKRAAHPEVMQAAQAPTPVGRAANPN